MQPQMAVADVDVQRIRLERMRTPTFHAAAEALGHPETRFRRVKFAHAVQERDVGLIRPLDRFPFVPDDPAKLDLDCYVAFNIQVQGLPLAISTKLKLVEVTHVDQPPVERFVAVG